MNPSLGGTLPYSYEMFCYSATWCAPFSRPKLHHLAKIEKCPKMEKKQFFMMSYTRYYVELYLHHFFFTSFPLRIVVATTTMPSNQERPYVRRVASEVTDKNNADCGSSELTSGPQHSPEIMVAEKCLE
jgi:hypothetical protein